MLLKSKKKDSLSLDIIVNQSALATTRQHTSGSDDTVTEKDEVNEVENDSNSALTFMPNVNNKIEINSDSSPMLKKRPSLIVSI